jgi:hypothetical protein
VRLGTPFESLHSDFFLGRFQHEGNLDFVDEEPKYGAFRSIADQIPTILVVRMDDQQS